MILRRVIDHVKRQHWTAVFLDFVIVVLGVFIGIQVSNWNAAREDHALGIDYILRLSADLERDRIATRQLIDYYSAVLDSVLEANRLLSDSNPDARQLVVAAYRATEYATTPPNRATWDQIVSSGHLGLLPGNATDGGLSEYYTFGESNTITALRVESSLYRQTLRSIMPLEIQLAIRDGCSDVRNESGIITGFTKECRVDVAPSILKAAAEKLQSNPTIRDDLRYQYSLVASVRNNYRGSLVAIEQAQAALSEAEDAQ